MSSDAQTVLQELNRLSDGRLGKQPQADSQHIPFSDVGSEPNPVEGSFLLHPADAQITSQEPNNLASDSHLVKWPRVDPQPMMQTWQTPFCNIYKQMCKHRGSS